MSKEWNILSAELKSKVKTLLSKTNTLKIWVNELEQDIKKISEVLNNEK